MRLLGEGSAEIASLERGGDVVNSDFTAWGADGPAEAGRVAAERMDRTTRSGCTITKRGSGSSAALGVAQSASKSWTPALEATATASSTAINGPPHLRPLCPAAGTRRHSHTKANT